MGFFGFNKPKNKISKKSISTFDLKSKYKLIIEEFIKKTSVPSIKLTAKSAKCSLKDSKFGGIPYMPKQLEYPCDNEGNPLRLLAQLNFNILPKFNNFPQKGILQFFEGENENYGVDFEEYT